MNKVTELNRLEIAVIAGGISKANCMQKGPEGDFFKYMTSSLDCKKYAEAFCKENNKSNTGKEKCMAFLDARYADMSKPTIETRSIDASVVYGDDMQALIDANPDGYI